MRNKILFIVSGAGLLLALVSAFIFSRAAQGAAAAVQSGGQSLRHRASTPTASSRATRRRARTSTSIPEVAGPDHAGAGRLKGQLVHKGDALLTIDDSVQRATAEQQRSQARSRAGAAARSCKAEPRPENSRGRGGAGGERAGEPQERAGSARQAAALLRDRSTIGQPGRAGQRAGTPRRWPPPTSKVVERQYELTKAGAWIYDIQNQERQYTALSKAYAASAALLAKYTIRAPADGVVLAVQTGVGSYVSPQGAYDSYTQGFDPLIVMGDAAESPAGARLHRRDPGRPCCPTRARSRRRCSSAAPRSHVPLTFVRIQPYVSPKIELSDERAGAGRRARAAGRSSVSRSPRRLNLYPGQLVDVYVGEVAMLPGAGCGYAAPCSRLSALACGCAVGPDFVRPARPRSPLCVSAQDPVETPAGARARRSTSAPGRKLARGLVASVRVPEARCDRCRGAGEQSAGSRRRRRACGRARTTCAAATASSFRRSMPMRPRPASGLGARASARRPRQRACSTCSRCPRSVSYALDVFGGERRLIEGLRRRSSCSARASRRPISRWSANIVNTVIARAAYRAEIDATQQLIELQRRAGASWPRSSGRPEPFPTPTC